MLDRFRALLTRLAAALLVLAQTGCVTAVDHGQPRAPVPASAPQPVADGGGDPGAGTDTGDAAGTPPAPSAAAEPDAAAVAEPATAAAPPPDTAAAEPTARPEHEPPPPDEPALPPAMHAALAAFGDRYSIVLVDLVTGRRWSHNADAAYHPASLVKLPVSLYVEHLVAAGELTWDTPFTYTEADVDTHGGPLAELPFGSAVPLAQLVDESLRHSNNVAVNILGRSLGWENVRRFAATVAGAFQPGPQATANAVAGWWLYLWDLEQREPERARHVLQPLAETPYLGRLAAGTPDGVAVVHKYGSYLGFEHDAGIVRGERPYLLVVMTGQEVAAGEEGRAAIDADLAIARAASAAWEYMQGPAAHEARAGGRSG